MYRKTELFHYGTPRHSGRYPYGSGDRPYQDREPYRIEERKESRVKKALKSAGKLAGKSALLGASIAARVVFSSAITSATLVGIAAAGFQFINSPAVVALLDGLAIKAGNWLFETYVMRGVNYANSNLDEVFEIGMKYLNSI